MTTKLTRPVSRETRATVRHGGRVLVVTLLPGDVLEFREKGRRTRWLLPIDAACWIAIKAAARARIEETRARRRRSR